MYKTPHPHRPPPLANIGKKPIRTVYLAFASLWFLLLEAQAEILLSLKAYGVQGGQEANIYCRRRHWLEQSTKTSTGTKYIYSTIL